MCIFASARLLSSRARRVRVRHVTVHIGNQPSLPGLQVVPIAYSPNSPNSTAQAPLRRALQMSCCQRIAPQICQFEVGRSRARARAQRPVQLHPSAPEPSRAPFPFSPLFSRHVHCRTRAVNRRRVCACRLLRGVFFPALSGCVSAQASDAFRPIAPRHPQQCRLHIISRAGRPPRRTLPPSTHFFIRQCLSRTSATTAPGTGRARRPRQAPLPRPRPAGA